MPSARRFPPPWTIEEHAEKSFSFGARDNSARAPVYDHMVAALKKELERKPWDGVETQTIGFLRLSG